MYMYDGNYSLLLHYTYMYFKAGYMYANTSIV